MPTRKKPQKRTATQTAADGRLEPGPGELIVRMYRQGLGDCFLLALPGTDGRARYLLIDCGVHARQTGGPGRLKQVMDHLAKTTEGRLDVVAATHEHADHLSGFVQKGSPFLRDNLSITKAWLAWTEKRGDPQADQLRKKRGAAQKIIDRAVQEAQRRAGGLALAEALAGLPNRMDFAHPCEGSVDEAAVARKIEQLRIARPSVNTAVDACEGLAMAGAAKEKPSSNELALGLLAAKAGDDNTVYCEPGSVQTVDGVEGFRAYVLAPPRSGLLENDKPTRIRGAKEDDPQGAYKEVYLTGALPNKALELSPRLALKAESAGGESFRCLSYPFTDAFSRRCDLLAGRKGGRDRRWADRDATPEATKSLIEGTYLSPRASWRRIDGNWLGAAETLALNLVADTNNTSLVLAFEWGKPGKGAILLFPADAQVGNWLSWRDQQYGEEKLKVHDLLSRVLLYKVGHHGSHNATLRRDPDDTSSGDPNGAIYGLELMKDIIAMIPVDWDAARKAMPDPWRMPHEPLYRRLREKSARRVLRSDLDMQPLDPRREAEDLFPKDVEWQPVPGLRGVQWRKSNETFETGTPGPLYYDVAIKLDR